MWFTTTWHCMVDHVLKMLTKKIHFFFKEAEKLRYKRKTPARRVVRVGRSLAGIRRRNTRIKEAEKLRYKRKTPARRVVRVGRSLAGIRRRNTRILRLRRRMVLRLMPASDLPPRTTRFGVFSFRRTWDGENTKIVRRMWGDRRMDDRPHREADVHMQT